MDPDGFAYHVWISGTTQVIRTKDIRIDKEEPLITEREAEEEKTRENQPETEETGENGNSEKTEQERRRSERLLAKDTHSSVQPAQSEAEDRSTSSFSGRSREGLRAKEKLRGPARYEADSANGTFVGNLATKVRDPELVADEPKTVEDVYQSEFREEWLFLRFPF